MLLHVGNKVQDRDAEGKRTIKVHQFILEGEDWLTCLDKIGELIGNGAINVEEDNSITLSVLRTKFIKVG